jgi:hypothetical protein
MDDKDLGYHDDKLISVSIEPDEQRATLTIQTLKWIECEDPYKREGSKSYRAENDKIVKIIMKLKEEQPYFEGKLGTIYPANDIFGIGIIKDVLHVSLTEGLLEFCIDSYEVV